MKKIFYLMRHGQTLFNLRKKIQGACDSKSSSAFSFLYPIRQTKGDARNWFQTQFSGTTFFTILIILLVYFNIFKAS